MNNTTDRKFHTVSLEDREMFEYNRTYEQVKSERDRVLAQPETRARYCLQFYYDFMDPEMNRKALDRFSEFMDVIEYNIEPYELY
jgi:hypothetical protein